MVKQPVATCGSLAQLTAREYQTHFEGVCLRSLEKVSDSPCWQHHPYGILSEVHVQLILNAIADAGSTT